MKRYQRDGIRQKMQVVVSLVLAATLLVLVPGITASHSGNATASASTDQTQINSSASFHNTFNEEAYYTTYDQDTYYQNEYNYYTFTDGAASSSSNTRVDVEIAAVSYPKTISAGQEVPFTVTVRNHGSMTAQEVAVTVQAYGQTKTVDNIQVQSGQQQHVEVPFTIPVDASGPEQVQVEARATAMDTTLDRVLQTFTIEPERFHMTLQAQPTRVVVGNPVEIQGMMSRAGASAQLYVDRMFVGTVTSNQVKRYSHTYMPDSPGLKRIELRAGNIRKTAFVRVDPQLGVTAISAPETTNTQDRFKVCATVFKASPGTVTLQLAVNGQANQEQTVYVSGEREHCFTTAITEKGTHSVTVQASADGVTAQQTHQMQVVESQITVNVFPQELTVEEGSGGLLRAKITNKNARSRTFQMQVEGLAGIAEVTEKSVSVDPGETKTTFVRVTPPRAGTYSGTVRVIGDGFTFAETPVRIHASTNPPLKDDRQPTGFVSRATEQVQRTVEALQDRLPDLGFLAAVVLVLSAATFLIYRWTRRGGVMEPRY